MFDRWLPRALLSYYKFPIVENPPILKHYKIGQAIKRVRISIKNLINDVHHKVSSLLVQNYKVIFLPTYETSQMVLKAKRKINCQSVRSMLTWSFGRFAEHLRQSCNCNGVMLVRTNEAYTSKSCPECGKFHTKLG
ncbi:hypothetical protein NIES2101_09560 [Calothrix sp. HK-06]|nr:hypothetical protein NIES2101_09560 [Calothrix sp. HK-06]